MGMEIDKVVERIKLYLDNWDGFPDFWENYDEVEPIIFDKFDKGETLDTDEIDYLNEALTVLDEFYSDELDSLKA